MNELQANKITSVIHSVNIGAVLSYRPYAAVLAKDLNKFLLNHPSLCSQPKECRVLNPRTRLGLGLEVTHSKAKLLYNSAITR